MENCTKNFEAFVLPAIVVKKKRHTNFRRYLETYKWCSKDKEHEAYNKVRCFAKSYEDYFSIFSVAKSRLSDNAKTALSDLLELNLTPDQCLEVCRASHYNNSTLDKIINSNYSFNELLSMYIESDNPMDRMPRIIFYYLMLEKVLDEKCTIPEQVSFEELSRKNN